MVFGIKYLTAADVVALQRSTLPPQGNVIVVGRKSPYSLYDPVIASFEDDKGLYNQADAGGFIKLQVSLTMVRVGQLRPLIGVQQHTNLLGNQPVGCSLKVAIAVQWPCL